MCKKAREFGRTRFLQHQHGYRDIPFGFSTDISHKRHHSNVSLEVHTDLRFSRCQRWSSVWCQRIENLEEFSWLRNEHHERSETALFWVPLENEVHVVGQWYSWTTMKRWSPLRGMYGPMEAGGPANHQEGGADGTSSAFSRKQVQVHEPRCISTTKELLDGLWRGEREMHRSQKLVMLTCGSRSGKNCSFLAARDIEVEVEGAFQGTPCKERSERYVAV